jgi:hypothetical protein
VTSDSAASWAPVLDTNGKKARYGVSYLRNVCAQAGVGLTETEPDEDVLAVDCAVQYPELAVRVQVKCTSRLTIRGRTKSIPVDESWIEKWSRSLVPVYLLVVIVPSEVSEWLEHVDEGTMHRTAAFWKRVDRGVALPSVKIPKGQRLTVDTISLWHKELLANFESSGEPQ